MKINLLDIPVYYISLEDQYENHKRMEAMLSDIGFKNVTRFSARYHHNGKMAGCADSHAQILSMGIKGPFIILEDDCFLDRDFPTEVEVPDDIDALYLGISYWARYANHSGPILHVRQQDENISQVYNMLATHAILYISKDYISFCKRAAQWAAEKVQHVDVVFAEAHKFYNVYAFNDPVFYQSSSELVTRGSIFHITRKNKEEWDHIYNNVGKSPDEFLSSIKHPNNLLDGFSFELLPLL